MNLALISYILKGASRDKLFLSLLCILITGSCISLFMSSSALIEQAQFSVVYMAGSLRVLGLLGLCLFVVFFVRRSFDARDVEYLLTRPISRVTFIASHAAAFSLLAFFVSFIFCLGFGLAAHDVLDGQGLFYWSTGVICEYLILINVSFFFAMVLSSPVAATLSTLGFYVLARLMGQLLYIVTHPPQIYPGMTFFGALFKMVSMMIPRLDLMTQTSWLLYGIDRPYTYPFILGQAVLFLGLIFTATLVDLRRRQF